jgi:hypothetical protein
VVLCQSASGPGRAEPDIRFTAGKQAFVREDCLREPSPEGAVSALCGKGAGEWEITQMMGGRQRDAVINSLIILSGTVS